jgi:hypothetical protein
MPLLRHHHADLQALAGAAAGALGIPDPAFVEKDYWVVELLRSVTRPLELKPGSGIESDVRVLFKGGTSLSKAYALIERFSEDVDILVVCGGLGREAREKRVMRPICDRAQMDLALTNDQVEHLDYSRGFTRNIDYVYPRTIISMGIRPGVRLEMGVRGGTIPGTQRCSVLSYIAEYVRQHDIDASFDDLAPVQLEVLAPVRTLAEKLALLHHAGTRAQAGDSSALMGAGRHMYDVYRLLSDPEVCDVLERAGSRMDLLAADVDGQSEKYGWTFTPRPPAGYAASVVFEADGQIGRAAKAAYQLALRLVWGTRPTFEQCCEVVQSKSSLL